MNRPLESATNSSATEPAFLGLQKLPSVGSQGAPITGKLSFSTATRIDGAIRGEVRSTALVVVSEQGSVQGTLRALEVVVFGEIRGDVHGVERVEIAPGGRIYGRVQTRALVVNDGAVIEAACVVQP